MPNGTYGAPIRPRAEQWRNRTLEQVRDDIADDLDNHDRKILAVQIETRDEIKAFRRDFGGQLEDVKTLVSRRLWYLTGIAFSLLLGILGVLVAVVANGQ
jgi:hypothetical protein